MEELLNSKTPEYSIRYIEVIRDVLRMFLEKESEVPEEEIDDLLWRHNVYNYEGEESEESGLPCSGIDKHNELIREAYRRGHSAAAAEAAGR